MPTHNYTINHRTSSHPPITQPQPHICYEGQCRNYVTYAKLQDSQQNFYLQCCSPLKSVSNLSVHLQFTMRPHLTLYYYYLKSIGVGWVGWKSKKVSRYFCTAPPRNVSLPRARSTPPRSCAPGAGPRTRVSRA